MACTDETTVLTTILASILFIVSEALPFVKNVKGDSITQIIVNGVTLFLKKRNEGLQPNPA